MSLERFGLPAPDPGAWAALLRAQGPVEDALQLGSVQLDLHAERCRHLPGREGVFAPAPFSLVKLDRVCAELEPCVSAFAERLDLAPWWRFAMGSTRELRVDVACALWGEVLLEMSCPVEGDSLFADALRARGEGYFSLGLLPIEETYGAARERFAEAGHRVLSEGSLGPLSFCRFATRDALGIDVELLNADGPAMAHLARKADSGESV